MWGNLVTPHPVIREVCCLAVNPVSFLHSTSLLQGKAGVLIMLDNVGQPCDSIPGDSACVLYGSERDISLAFNLTLWEVLGSEMLDIVDG